LLRQINSYELRYYNALNYLNNARAFTVIIYSYGVPYELIKTHPYGEALKTHPHGEALKTHPYGEALKTHPYGEALKTHPHGEALKTHPHGEALLEPFVLVT